MSPDPKQTAFCSGQSIPITQNQALYALLGSAFGGAGGNFSLPNTGGRTIVGFGNNGSIMPLGAIGGEADHALTLAEMPAHTHALNATNQGTGQNGASGTMPAVADATATIYGAPSGLLPLGGSPLSTEGGGQPHANMQPSLPINVAIVLYGIYPSRN